MKKFIGAICSAVAGILTFVMLSLNWLGTKLTPVVGNVEKDGYTGWELILNKVGDAKDAFSEVNGYVLYRIFAIIMLVVAVLLIIMAVVMLLKSLKVIKIKLNLSSVNNVLLAVLAVSVIVAIIGIAIMASDMAGETILGKLECYPTIGAWIQLAISIVACGCGWALARKDK